MSNDVQEQVSPARMQWLKDLRTETGKVAKIHSQGVIDSVDMGEYQESQAHAMAAMSALNNDLNHYNKVIRASGLAPQSDRWKKCLENEVD